jgi:hypothetical protein
MLRPFVYIFSVLSFEIGEGVVPHFTNKRIGLSWAAVKKFDCQAVNKLVNGFKVKSSV